MKIVEQTHKILTPINGAEILKHIERCGRVAYKSEDKITDDSAARFVKMLIERGHESVLEHFSFSVLFVTDRGISHEIVRHRLASYTQESTRYCNYSLGKFNGEITVIKPTDLSGKMEFDEWKALCKRCENVYKFLCDVDVAPQIARSVLPNCLKTEIVMTANLREWRHFLKLRTAPDAHPQMRALVNPLLNELKSAIPIVFDDI